MAVKDAQNGKDEQEGADKVRLNLWLTRGVHDELRMLAGLEGRSVSDIVRQVLNEHLRNNQDVIKRGTQKGAQR